MLDFVTVRDAFFDVLRERGMTTIFSNPGSTEIPLLAGMPADMRFVLALHESSVVGMTSGYALGSGRPALALLHTTPGLGNAVSAIATARVTRIPIVVVVGQQDRRHIAFEPFLSGKLEKLAGDYPVWVDQPLRGADVPDAIRRAEHEAVTHRGPALVIVPMDDWDTQADVREPSAPGRVVRPTGVGSGAVDELAALLDGKERIGLVVGALAANDDTWAAIVELAEHCSAHVWQEAFSARPGFPQDHRLFAGHLPADRGRLRTVLGSYDAVLCLGAPAFRQYGYADGAFAPAGLPIAVVTPDADEVHRSAATLAVLAEPGPVCRALAARLRARTGEPPAHRRPEPLDLPAQGAPLLPGHVFDALAQRLPRDVVLLEESPSSRVGLNLRLPALSPWGYVSAAMGGLGFALPAATGLRLARPDLPVVAITGDGSALYSIQALWSAVEYGSGALFVVLSNGGYAVMDMLAGLHGDDAPPWPGIGHLDLASLAAGFGCEARRIDDHASLTEVLDEVVPGLAGRTTPLLLDVAVETDPAFVP
jgi:benzoylformate decarboxylase